jgi:hypothetical protein
MLKEQSLIEKVYSGLLLEIKINTIALITAKTGSKINTIASPPTNNIVFIGSSLVYQI